MWAVGIVAVLVVSCTVAVGSASVLRRLPAPAEDASYAAAIEWRFSVGAAAVCAACGLCAVATLPWPAWLNRPGSVGGRC